MGMLWTIGRAMRLLWTLVQHVSNCDLPWTPNTERSAGIVLPREVVYRSDRHAEDNIWAITGMAVTLICELYRLRKAFDTIDRATVWKIMKPFGIPEKVSSIIKSLPRYVSATLSVIQTFHLPLLSPGVFVRVVFFLYWSSRLWSTRSYRLSPVNPVGFNGPLPSNLKI